MWRYQSVHLTLCCKLRSVDLLCDLYPWPMADQKLHCVNSSQYIQPLKLNKISVNNGSLVGTTNLYDTGDILDWSCETINSHTQHSQSPILIKEIKVLIPLNKNLCLQNPHHCLFHQQNNTHICMQFIKKRNFGPEPIKNLQR